MDDNRTLEDRGTLAYQIKKIELNDGTILDVNSITHATLVKDVFDKDKNEVLFKVSYCFKDKTDLLALSNQCVMLAHTFKFMREYNIDFKEAVCMYDKILEEAKNNMKKNNIEV